MFSTKDTNEPTQDERVFQGQNLLHPGDERSRAGANTTIVSEESQDDFDEDDEVDLFPGGLELPAIRSPRGSIHSIMSGSSCNSRRNSACSGCSQGSNASTISWTSLQALRIAAAKARSTSLPQPNTMLEYSLFLSESKVDDANSQLPKNEYRYLAVSPDVMFQTKRDQYQQLQQQQQQQQQQPARPTSCGKSSLVPGLHDQRHLAVSPDVMFQTKRDQYQQLQQQQQQQQQQPARPTSCGRGRRNKPLCKLASFEVVDDSDHSTPSPDILNLKRGSWCSNRNFRRGGGEAPKRKGSVCRIRQTKSSQALNLKGMRSRSMSLPQTVSIDPNLGYASLEGFKGLMDHKFFFYPDPLASPEYPINQEGGFDETLSSNLIMKGMSSKLISRSMERKVKVPKVGLCS
ncbi:hypothetical protein TCAL_17309 [Tigriopus californicus]|uniref:Uncharacterized protein n=1 Tax=Tigriopus californicus TaxID=6832 RepID=A0A553P0C5_TIGCA|nr:hypothetical protein TCAL_17309 [Tigriopus californicus]